MGRYVFVLAVSAAMLAAGFGALAAGGTRTARACSLGGFQYEHISEFTQVEVAAIGTLGATHGAAIEFHVEEYYRAPDSNASVLIINNLLHNTTPSCEPIPQRLLAFEPGTRGVAMLTRDLEGIGANWQVPLVSGFVPIVDETVESMDTAEGRYQAVRVPLDQVREELRTFGPMTSPDPGRREVAPAPLRAVDCLAGPPTIHGLARTAPIIALGTIEQVNPFNAQVRVATGFLGATEGDLLKIDNRNYENSWDLGECEETTLPGPRFEQGQKLLMFLRTQEASDLGGLRGAGIDGGGIFYPTMPAPDEWSLPNNIRSGMSLDEATEVIRAAVAARPALADSTPDVVPSGPGFIPSTGGDADNDTPVWLVALIAAAAGALAGGAVTFAVRRR